MVPELPGRRNPSQDGSVNTWETESKSGWFREYIPGKRNPSQDGSVNILTDRSGPFSSNL